MLCSGLILPRFPLEGGKTYICQSVDRHGPGGQPASLGSCIHFVRMTAVYPLPLLPWAPKVTLATQADQSKQENNRRDGQVKTEASAHCVAQEPGPGRDGSAQPSRSLPAHWPGPPPRALCSQISSWFSRSLPAGLTKPQIPPRDLLLNRSSCLPGSSVPSCFVFPS